MIEKRFSALYCRLLVGSCALAMAVQAAPPVVLGDAATLLAGQKVLIAVLANDSGEIDPVTLSIVDAPSSGNAMVREGKILYSANPAASGGDSFTYHVENGSGESSIGTVAITFSTTLKIPNDQLDVPDQPPATTYSLVPAFPGVVIDRPLSMASPPGDTQRLVICEKKGMMHIIQDVTADTPASSVFFDLPQYLIDKGESLFSNTESGLLGLVFHPNHATNRNLYLFYSVTKDDIRRQRVSLFRTRANNPNVINPNSEMILIEQVDRAGIHNGGDMHFGPDGYLYISLGDEGQGNDGYDNSQTITKNFFSGMLRIDVDKLSINIEPTPHPSVPTDNGIARYSIPRTNPFVHTSLLGPWDGTYNGVAVSQTDVRREFFATGLRNPWRFSIDPTNGEIWCGDVGQTTNEEVNLIVNGGNYGWAFREGFQDGPKSAQTPATFVEAPPLYAYDRDDPIFGGRSVTGGLVYRGTGISALTGKYLFADYVSGNVWSLQRNGTLAPIVERIAGESGITSFALDPSNGDVLVSDDDGDRILRLVANPATSTFPTTLSATGLFADLTDLSPSPGLTPYDVNLPFWSDHALKRRWVIVPDGVSQFTWARETPWDLPAGTVWVKHFDLETERGNPATAKRIETRLIVKNAAGSYGVSYRWNNEQTEAALVADGGEEFDIAVNVPGQGPVTQRWQIPSRASCRTCHTPEAGHALSFNTRQLNFPHDILGQTGNQLTTFESNGYFDNSPGSPNLLPRHVRTDEDEFSVEARVRSYLAVNCAYCHQENGTAGGSSWDGRASLNLAETGLLNGPVADDNGDSGNLLVVPGDVDHSVVLSRMSETNGYTRMPPIATRELDQENITLLTDWIANKLPDRLTYPQWRLREFASDVSPIGAPDIDADDDGTSNHDEFLSDTDPNDATSFQSLDIDVSDDVSLKFSIPENRSFRIMTSTDLSPWTPWDVPGNQRIPSAGGIVEMTGPMDAPKRFFTLEISGN